MTGLVVFLVVAVLVVQVARRRALTAPLRAAEAAAEEAELDAWLTMLKESA